MTDNTKRWCVLIPCSSTETWAVPQNCLGEIVTLYTDSTRPPDEITWRGRTVPVLDFGSDDGSVWREPRRGAGLVAIFLGLKGEGCEYWGLAVRGQAPTHITTNGACAQNDEVHADACVLRWKWTQADREPAQPARYPRIVRCRPLAVWRTRDEAPEALCGCL